MSPEQLEAILTVLRAAGVKTATVGSLSVEFFGPEPEPEEYADGLEREATKPVDDYRQIKFR